jgi:hypothetical protein
MNQPRYMNVKDIPPECLCFAHPCDPDVEEKTTTSDESLAKLDAILLDQTIQSDSELKRFLSNLAETNTPGAPNQTDRS